MSDTTVRPTRSGVVPWPEDVAARYVAKGYWEGRSLGSQLAETARRTPDAISLVDGDVRLTFRELLARADGAADRMRALRIRPDDRIVLQLPNRWEHVLVTVACLRLGAIPVWALPQHRHHELTGVVAHAEARAIVVPDRYRGFDHQAMAHEIVAAVPSAEHVLVAGADLRPGSVDLHALCAPAEHPDEVAAALDAAAPGGEAVATLLLSGGTTGLPKLIARTGNDLAYMMKRAAEVCGFGPDTRYLAVLPLGHGFPNTGPGVLGTLLVGGRVVIAASPAPEVAFAAIEREGVTATSAVPAIVQRWLEHRDQVPDADLSSLRLLQVGAARLPGAVAGQIGPKLGCTLQQVFGMGEGLLCLTRLDDPAEVVQHTQGRPISPDDEILVVDADGEPVPPGEPGVLLTRGPYTPRGYYRAPELNARAFVGDGWYCTGDVVRQTADGSLVVVGREKDVINRGGEKITAEEVETFAGKVDGVSQAAAVAMPDAQLGEAVCLFVVPATGRQVDLADVREVLLDAGLARFKLPERLVTIDAMPMTGVGKVDKKALRAHVSRLLDEEHAAR
ncbi:2,3-dihydroxybenzoate-AMP ligase [Micromonospora globispora]|uniref:2,3-dihydroxybenzoate-AMP ligase n=1 Tax=Micromonospora globispora TaxID=1450148 RepID=A0A317KHZ5_9ACTN|nr:AMP-binding protein [Micromonospora globispora]PWU52123.1 2,3-dihydroxybenzoate-AMP ligase [Micromonospora globispora]